MSTRVRWTLKYPGWPTFTGMEAVVQLQKIYRSRIGHFPNDKARELPRWEWMKRLFDEMKQPQLELRIWREARKTRRGKSLYVREKMLGGGERGRRGELREVPVPAPQEAQQVRFTNPRLHDALRELQTFGAQTATTTVTQQATVTLPEGWGFHWTEVPRAER